MKKNYFILLLTIVMFFVFGCQKQELLTNDQQKRNNISVFGENVNMDYSDIKVINGMLSFENLDSFRSFYNQLEKSNYQYQAIIIEQLKEMNEKEINEFYDTYSVDDFLVLRTVEKKFNFASLRKHIEILEFDYNKVFDQSKLINPDDHYIDNHTLRTLLNENCEIIIGNSIFVFFSEEVIVEIFNKDYITLKLINTNNLDVFLKKGKIKIYGDYDDNEDCKGGCRENISTSWDVHTWWERSTKRKIEGKIVVRNNAITFTHYIMAYTKTHYWTGSRWKNWRTDIYTSIGGYVYKKNKCDKDPIGYRGASDDCENKYSHSIKASMYSAFFSVKSNEISSSQETDGGSLGITLVF